MYECPQISCSCWSFAIQRKGRLPLPHFKKMWERWVTLGFVTFHLSCLFNTNVYVWNGVEVGAILLNQINMCWVPLMYKIQGDIKMIKVTSHTYYLLFCMFSYLSVQTSSLPLTVGAYFLEFYIFPISCSVVLCYRWLALINCISQASHWVLSVAPTLRIL